VIVLVPQQTIEQTEAATPLIVTVPGEEPKLVPLMMTVDPTGAADGFRLKMPGPEKTNGTPLLDVPFTVTTTFPFCAPDGATATMLVAIQDVIEVAVIPLNFTVLEPWLEPKFAPLIVTDVPALPDWGLIPVMPGPPPTTKT
jgi:hypothetical protein